MKTPKQYTVGANQSDKTLIADFCAELTRPGAVKDSIVSASEREVVEIALDIATENRFHKVEVPTAVKDDDGEPVLDDDGNPIVEMVTETRDRFQDAWRKIVNRDHSEKGVAQADKLRAEIAALKAELRMKSAVTAAPAEAEVEA